MWTVITLVVITVWMMRHVCWRARSSSFICSHCHVCLSSWLFIRFCCPLWVATSLMAMWLLFLVWKGAGQGGLWCSPQPCPLLVYIMCCCCWSIVGCCIAFSMWPLLFKWENERGLLLTWNYGDSDDDRHRHHLDDAACLLTCQVITMSRCASSSWWHDNAVLLLLLACMVVVGGSQTVVAEGGGGRKLFVCWCCVSAVLGKHHSCSSYIR